MSGRLGIGRADFCNGRKAAVRFGLHRRLLSARAVAHGARYVECMGKGISYRDPLGYSLATVAVALADNPEAKTVLAGWGYTEVSDAALETIRRNKPAELEKIRIKVWEAEQARRAKIAQQWAKERLERLAETQQEPR